jgi:hypothetical protein
MICDTIARESCVLLLLLLLQLSISFKPSLHNVGTGKR